MRTSNPMLKKRHSVKRSKCFCDDYWRNSRQNVYYAYLATCNVCLFIHTDDRGYDEDASINWRFNRCGNHRICIYVLPRISPFGAPIYAAVEGVVLGSISAVYTMKFGDSIVLNAVLLTISILFAMLVLYATRVVKVTDKFRTGVMAATLGIMVMYLVVFLLNMFGVTVPYIHQGGTIGIIISAVVIVVAALNLLLDFDLIENGVRSQAPKYMEWYTAMGLMLTLVWLYLEILRFVSYFTKMTNKNPA